jgi:hypothetical protein
VPTVHDHSLIIYLWHDLADSISYVIIEAIKLDITMSVYRATRAQVLTNEYR